VYDFGFLLLALDTISLVFGLRFLLFSVGIWLVFVDHSWSGSRAGCALVRIPNTL
jgi:hypothetical protein